MSCCQSLDAFSTAQSVTNALGSAPPDPLAAIGGGVLLLREREGRGAPGYAHRIATPLAETRRFCSVDSVNSPWIDDRRVRYNWRWSVSGRIACMMHRTEAVYCKRRRTFLGVCLATPHAGGPCKNGIEILFTENSVATEKQSSASLNTNKMMRRWWRWW